MRIRFTSILLAISATAVPFAQAQQPAPPPPAFAPTNTTAAGVRSMAFNCAACHGTNGKAAAGSTGASLAGMPAAKTIQAMKDFRDAKRPATVMHQIARGFSDEEVAAVAEYFARQP